jgi:hypothetical protein
MFAIATCAAFALAAGLGVPPAEAGSLSGIRLDVSAAAGGNMRVILAFANGVPQYKIFGNGTTDVSVILQGTTRGVSAPTTVIGRDPLKSISVDSRRRNSSSDRPASPAAGAR